MWYDCDIWVLAVTGFAWSTFLGKTGVVYIHAESLPICVKALFHMGVCVARAV